MKPESLIEPGPTDEGTVDRPLLHMAVEEYLAALERGSIPNRTAYLNKYASIRTDLAACLESLDFIRAAAGTSHFDPPDEALSPQPETWTLGEYRVQCELGRGGMGVVYQAEQTPLGRLVALKILPLAGLLDDRQLKRFRNEARAAALLKHPNIVSVYSVGCERGVHYYAMELVEGQSLAEIIEAGFSGDASSQDTTPIAALSTQRTSDRKSYFHHVARLGIQAARALHYAHGQSVVHRDIKPSNLLVDQAGNLHITDFGLAQVQTGDDLTLSGDLVGTLRYMSPEQWDGKTTDGRTDIYALGLTLFELIAGRPAHRGETRQQIMKHALADPSRRLDRIDRRVPQDLATIIQKAMERDPADRYPTAAALADDLQRFLDQRPVMARPASPRDRLFRWARRNPVVAALVALVTCLLVLLAAGSVGVAWRSTAIAQNQRLSLYAREIRLAHQAAAAGNHLEAEQILSGWVPDNPAADTDPRGFEWFYVWRLCHEPSIEQTISYPMPVYNVAVTAPGRQIAVGWMSAQVDIWNQRQIPLKRPQHRLMDHAVGVGIVRQLNQSEDLVTGDQDGAVYIWGATDFQTKEGPIQIEVAGDQNDIRAIDVSDDDRLLAIGAGNLHQGSIHVWDRSTQQWILQQHDLQGAVFAAFGPADMLIVAPQRGGALQVRAPRDAGRSVSASDNPSPGPAEVNLGYTDPISYDIQTTRVQGMAVSPDRSCLVLATENAAHGLSQLDLWDTVTWQRRQRIPLSDGAVKCLSYSADGRLLAVGHDAGILTMFDMTKRAVLFKKRIHAGAVTDIVFSPDGEQLVTSGTDCRVHVWRLASLRMASHTIKALGDDFPAIWSARFVSGSVAAVSDASGRVSLWDVTTGDLKKQFHVDNGDANMVQLAVSPDRRLIGVTCGHWPPAQKPTAAKFFLLDVKSSETTFECEIPRGTYYTVSSFSPDSRYFALGSYHYVVVIDVAAGKILHELPIGDHTVKHVAFSPDGKWLACSISDGHLQMFDARTFRLTYTIRTDGKYSGDVSFSPDSRIFAVVGFDKRIRLFDSTTGRRTGPEFAECQIYPATVAFSPDGKRLVTGAMDGKVRIWHAKSGEELLNFDVPKSWYPSCAFSDDSSALVVGCGHLAQAFLASERNELRTLTRADLNEVSCAKVVFRPKRLQEQDY